MNATEPLHDPQREDALSIDLIIGSTRSHRFADVPARWIASGAVLRTNLRIRMLDLREFSLPLLGEAPVQPDAPGTLATRRWREAVSACDAFILTVAEYNHGPSAALKSALDSALDEWARKPIAFVGYGGVGGARAVEQLRLVALELRMAPVRTAVHIGGEAFVAVAHEGRSLDAYTHLQQSRAEMFDELAWWARALRVARSARLAPA